MLVPERPAPVPGLGLIFSIPGQGRMGTLLIVDQLPHDCNEQELTALFKPFGHVVSVRLIRDHLHSFLGFAFVEIEKFEEASCAVSKLNGTEHRGLHLLVSLVKDPQNTA